jgi:hypothetical protein
MYSSNWWKRFSRNAAPKIPSPPLPEILVQRGIIREGPYLVLVPLEFEQKRTTVRVITVSLEFVREYRRYETEFLRMQQRLAEYAETATYKRRKRKAKAGAEEVAG